LIDVREMRGESGENAFRRACILCDVWNNEQFRDDTDFAASDDEAMAILDEHCEDLCLSFLELRQLLAHFPDQPEWQDGRLRSMYEQMRSEVSAKQKSERDSRPQGTRRSVTVKEFEVVQGEAKDYKFRLDRTEEISQDRHDLVNRLRCENERLTGENESLRQENTELREENVKLKTGDREAVTA
jgi:hypothetical protein